MSGPNGNPPPNHVDALVIAEATAAGLQERLNQVIVDTLIPYNRVIANVQLTGGPDGLTVLLLHVPGQRATPLATPRQRFKGG